MNAQPGNIEPAPAERAYGSELAEGWRPLAAACLGMTTGYTMVNYANNLFIPQLVGQFGWPRSQVALIGVTVLIALVSQPLAGRAGDRFGPRAVAAVGVCCGPLIFLAMSLLRNSFWVFLLLNVAQVALVASTTAAVVYSRLVFKRFDRSLGLALSLMNCSPPLAAALLVPLLSHFIGLQGWRSGYQAAAVYAALGGGLTLAMMPSRQRSATHGAPRRGARPREAAQPLARPRAQPAAQPAGLLKSRAFWVIMIGLACCNFSAMMQTTQLKLVFLSGGVAPGFATALLSVYALSVIAGRLLCGLALDRFAAHGVSAVALGLPGLGLLILAWAPGGVFWSIAAVIMLAASIGAEGDLAAYLARRYFPLDAYGTVLGFIMGALALSAATGALVLSATLVVTGGFTPFLLIGGVLAFLGSATLWSLRKIPQISEM